MRTLYITEQTDAHLVQAMRQAGHVVHTLHPDEADWAIVESRHQIIVYDIATADLSRLRQWSLIRPAHAVLLTILSEDSRSTPTTVLRAGADACLRKPVSVIELEARIQALLRRAVKETADAGSPPPVDQLTIGMRTRIISYAGRQLSVTPREHALLFLLARAAGNAVSRDVLCQHLWSEDDEPRPERIDLYISRLRQKLATLGSPNTLETLRSFGYRLQGPVLFH